MTTAIDIDIRGKVTKLRTAGTVTGPNGGEFFFFFPYIGKFLILPYGSLNTLPTSAIYQNLFCTFQSLRASASFHPTCKIQARSELVLFLMGSFL